MQPVDSLKVVTWRIPNVTARDLGRATLPPEGERHALAEAMRAASSREILHFPTCQRVLLALVTRAPLADVAAQVAAAWRKASGADLPPPEAMEGFDAFAHLSEVASSLDSLVPGEAQVLGQLKDAWQRAEEEGLAGKGLKHVFQLVFRTAKRVRTDTALFEGKVSLVPLTLEILDEHLRGKDGPRSAVVGTGTIGLKMAEVLAQRGGPLWVVSRDAKRAAEAAGKVGARPATYAEFLGSPPELDVVVLAARADAPVLDARAALAARNGRDLLVLDLAMPRNAAEDVATAPGVRLVGMDELSAVSERAKTRREGELVRARAVLEEELARIRSEYAALPMNREIVELREEMLAAAGERFAKGHSQFADRSPGFSDPEFRKWYEQTVRHLVHVAQARLRRERPPGPHGTEEPE